jgi:hypothetical protein
LAGEVRCTQKVEIRKEDENILEYNSGLFILLIFYANIYIDFILSCHNNINLLKHEKLRIKIERIKKQTRTTTDLSSN